VTSSAAQSALASFSFECVKAPSTPVVAHEGAALSPQM
jgi:hypothetical protein